MIYEINIKDYNKEINLKSDIAGQEPIYVYDNIETIYYSNNLKELLDKVKSYLKVSNLSISYLLKNGVIPTPNTVYDRFYIISIGNMLNIKKVNNIFELSFSRYFPFFQKNIKNEPSVDRTLNILADATISKINNNQNNYLFHSAGKDSNTIALSLSQNDFTDVCCVSHKSKGKSDESEISKSIAKKLGFSHTILYEPEILTMEHKSSINNYFKNIPFPVMDVVSLAYPIYNTQIDFHNSNIIDGMGNDVYIGHIPSKQEYNFANYLSKISFCKPITNNFNSENYLNILGTTRIEWVGLIGFMDRDCSNIYNDFISTDTKWKEIEKEVNATDYFDLRAKIRGGIIDQEIFMRKVRNFGDINDANIIFPWTDNNVAEYFNNIDSKYLYDKNNFKNKLFLRDILKNKLDLDSDKLGKLGYTFDYWKILLMMIKDVKDEVIECKLWDKKGIEILFNRLYNRSIKNDRFSNRAKSLIQRLYLISAWYNKNKYVNNNEE